MTNNDKLRELADEWRGIGTTLGAENCGRVFEQCADELEAVIQDE